MRFLKNCLLALGATGVGIGLLEILVFPYFLAVIPTNLLVMTQEFARQLGQSSKAGVIPRDYILLTGDSYAEGLGDALRKAGTGTRQAYASAHFIAERLGRDVVTVGRGGWSNTSSALAPGLFAAQARMSILYAVPPPAAIFYYFYEGNDLHDNLRWARLAHGGDLAARPYSPGEIAGFVGVQRDSEARFLRKLSRFGQANLPAAHFMLRIFDLRIVEPLRQLFRPREPENAAPRPQEGTNQAMIGGKVVDLPDRLQGPALELTDIEWSNGVLVLKTSLEAMKAESPGVPVTVVYIPSPLSSYDLVSASVSYQMQRIQGPATGPRAATAPSSQVAERQNRLRRTVCEVAHDLGFAFVDVTPAIRSAGRRRLLHGPSDWTHFDLEGYRILGTTVADFHASNSHDHVPENCTPASL